MAYFTWEELTSKYRKLAQDFDASAVNSTWAPLICAELDSRVGQRFTVPFTPTPPAIKNLAMDLCYWQMTYKEDSQDTLKEYIDERIEGLLNGTITLNDPVTGQPIAANAQVALTTSGTASSFGMDRPEDFSVDCDWQRSFRNARGEW